MWAHAQVLHDGTSGETPDLAAGLKHQPTRNLSRLICPRRLEPDTAYVACVVPVFEQGRRAGLGQKVAPDETLAWSWSGAQASGLELPLYHHWSFSTGPAGDFETLARRLKAPAEQDQATREALGRLGRAPVEVDADLLLQDPAVRAGGREAVRAAYLAQYEGAMLSLKPGILAEPGQSEQIAADLAALLNAGELRALRNLALEEEEQAAHEVTLVGPPVYGAWHARAHAVNPALRSRWLHELNLSVPRRLAAGVGTRVVQAHQEDFMQAAWQQMGDILKAERLLSLAHLSVRSLGRIVQRLEHLSPERRLQFLAPAASRMMHTGQPGPALTLWGYLRTTSLPDAAADPAMRRGLAAGRGWMRRAEPAPRAVLGTELTRSFASVDRLGRLLDVARFRVDGIGGLRALEGLVLPQDPQATLDVPGLGLRLRVESLQGLQQEQQALRGLKPEAYRRPSVSDKLAAGVLLDRHWNRIDELTSALARDAAAGGPAQAAPEALDIAAGLLDEGRLRPEGVLLSAVRTDRGFSLAAPQGLKVDARNGALEVAKALRSPAGPRGAPLARGVKPGAIATVAIAAVRRQGHQALFNTLPVGTLARPADPGAPPQPVEIGLRPGGRFDAPAATVVGPAATGRIGDRIGITVVPPVHDAPTLDRFRLAWRDRLEREAAPRLPRAMRIEPVAYRTDTVVAAATQALDVAQQVPRRISSLIQLAGQSLELGREQPGLTARQLVSIEKYVLPPSFDRVMAYPRISESLYLKLARLDRSAFMPGVESIPDDAILLLKTNPKFVDAFLVGCNHEMGRELLWRGFPTDQRGTPFQRFWPAFDPATVDIEPIHRWRSTLPLGVAGAPRSVVPGVEPVPHEQLVLLVRGQLLRRYPDTNLYAVDRRAGESAPVFDATRTYTSPVGAGVLPPDITFFLFPIDPARVADYWFVLEEPMSEPRFGFDDGQAPRQVPRVTRRGGGQLIQGLRLSGLSQPPAADTWLDVDWGDVGTPVGRHLTLQDLASVRLTPESQLPSNVRRSLGGLSVAGSHAAQVATALLQRPFRGYFAGTRLATTE